MLDPTKENETEGKVAQTQAASDAGLVSGQLEPGQLITATFTAVDADDNPINQPDGWKLQVIARRDGSVAFESSDFKSEGNVHVIEFTLDDPVKGHVVIIDDEGTVLSRPGNFILTYGDVGVIEGKIPEGFGINIDTDNEPRVMTSGQLLNDPESTFYPLRTKVIDAIFQTDIFADSYDVNVGAFFMAKGSHFPVVVKETGYVYDFGLDDRDLDVPPHFFYDYVGAPDFLRHNRGIIPNGKLPFETGSIYFDNAGQAFWYNKGDEEAAFNEGKIIADIRGRLLTGLDGFEPDTSKRHYVGYVGDEATATYTPEGEWQDGTGAALTSVVKATLKNGTPMYYQYADLQNTVSNVYNANFEWSEQDLTNIVGTVESEAIGRKGPFFDPITAEPVRFEEMGTGGVIYDREGNFVDYEDYGDGPDDGVVGLRVRDLKDPDGYIVANNGHTRFYGIDTELVFSYYPRSFNNVEDYTFDGMMFDTEIDEPTIKPFHPGWKVPEMLGRDTTMAFMPGGSEAGFVFMNDEFGFNKVTGHGEWSTENYLRIYDKPGYFGNNIVGNGAPTGVDLNNYLHYNGVKLFEGGAVCFEYEETSNPDFNFELPVGPGNYEFEDKIIPISVLLPGTDTFIEFNHEAHDSFIDGEFLQVFGNLAVPKATFASHVYVKPDGTSYKFGENGYVQPEYLFGECKLNHINRDVNRSFSLSSKGVPYNPDGTLWTVDGKMYVSDPKNGFFQPGGNISPYGSSNAHVPDAETLLDRYIEVPADSPNFIPFEFEDGVIATIEGVVYVLNLRGTLNHDIPSQFGDPEKFKLFGQPSTSLSRRFEVEAGKPYAFDPEGVAILGPRPEVVPEWDDYGTYYPYGKEEGVRIEMFDAGWSFNPAWGDDVVVYKIPSETEEGIFEIRVGALADVPKDVLANRLAYDRELGYPEIGTPGTGMSFTGNLTSNIVAWDDIGEPVRYDDIKLIDRAVWAFGTESEQLTYKPAGSNVFVDSSSPKFVNLDETKEYATRNGIVYGKDEGQLSQYHLCSDGNAVMFGEPNFVNDCELVVVVNDSQQGFKPGELPSWGGGAIYVPNTNHKGEHYGLSDMWIEDGSKYLQYNTNGRGNMYDWEGNLNLSRFLVREADHEDFVTMPELREVAAYTANGYAVYNPRIEREEFGQPNTFLHQQWDTRKWVFGFNEAGEPLKDRSAHIGTWDETSKFLPYGKTEESDKIEVGAIGWRHPFSSEAVIAISPERKPIYSTDDLPKHGELSYGEIGWFLADDWLTNDKTPRAVNHLGNEINPLYSTRYLDRTWYGDNSLVSMSQNGIRYMEVVGPDHEDYKEKPAETELVATEMMGGNVYESVTFPGSIHPETLVVSSEGSANWRFTQGLVSTRGILGYDENGIVIFDRGIDPESVAYVNKIVTADTKAYVRIGVTAKVEGGTEQVGMIGKGTFKSVIIEDGETKLVEPKGFLVANKVMGIINASNPEGVKVGTFGLYHYQSNSPMTETLVYVHEDGTVAKQTIEVAFTGSDLSESRKLQPVARVENAQNGGRVWQEVKDTRLESILIHTYGEDGEKFKVDGWLAGYSYKTPMKNYVGDSVDVKSAYRTFNYIRDGVAADTYYVPAFDIEYPLSFIHSTYNASSVIVKAEPVNTGISLGHFDDSADVLVAVYRNDKDNEFEKAPITGMGIELTSAVVPDEIGNVTTSLVTNSFIPGLYFYRAKFERVKQDAFDLTTATLTFNVNDRDKLPITSNDVVLSVHENQDLETAKVSTLHWTPEEIGVDSLFGTSRISGAEAFNGHDGTILQWYMKNPKDESKIDLNQYGLKLVPGSTNKGAIVTIDNLSDLNTQVKFKSEGSDVATITTYLGDAMIDGVTVKAGEPHDLQIPDQSKALLVPAQYIDRALSYDTYLGTRSETTTLYLLDTDGKALTDAYDVFVSTLPKLYSDKVELKFKGVVRHEDGVEYGVYSGESFARQVYGTIELTVESKSGWTMKIEAESVDQRWEARKEAGYLGKIELSADPLTIVANAVDKSIITAKMWYEAKPGTDDEMQPVIDHIDFPIVVNAKEKWKAYVSSVQVGSEQDPEYKWRLSTDVLGKHNVVVGKLDRGRDNEISISVDEYGNQYELSETHSIFTLETKGGVGEISVFRYTPMAMDDNGIVFPLDINHPLVISAQDGDKKITTFTEFTRDGNDYVFNVVVPVDGVYQFTVTRPYFNMKSPVIVETYGNPIYSLNYETYPYATDKVYNGEYNIAINLRTASGADITGLTNVFMFVKDKDGTVTELGLATETLNEDGTPSGNYSVPYKIKKDQHASLYATCESIREGDLIESGIKDLLVIPVIDNSKTKITIEGSGNIYAYEDTKVIVELFKEDGTPVTGENDLRRIVSRNPEGMSKWRFQTGYEVNGYGDLEWNEELKRFEGMQKFGLGIDKYYVSNPHYADVSDRVEYHGYHAVSKFDVEFVPSNVVPGEPTVANVVLEFKVNPLTTGWTEAHLVFTNEEGVETVFSEYTKAPIRTEFQFTNIVLPEGNYSYYFVSESKDVRTESQALRVSSEVDIELKTPTAPRVLETKDIRDGKFQLAIDLVDNSDRPVVGLKDVVAKFAAEGTELGEIGTMVHSDDVPGRYIVDAPISHDMNAVFIAVSESIVEGGLIEGKAEMRWVPTIDLTKTEFVVPETIGYGAKGEVTFKLFDMEGNVVSGAKDLPNPKDKHGFEIGKWCVNVHNVDNESDTKYDYEHEAKWNEERQLFVATVDGTSPVTIDLVARDFYRKDVSEVRTVAVVCEVESYDMEFDPARIKPNVPFTTTATMKLKRGPTHVTAGNMAIVFKDAEGTEYTFDNVEKLAGNKYRFEGIELPKNGTYTYVFKSTRGWWFTEERSVEVSDAVVPDWTKTVTYIDEDLVIGKWDTVAKGEAIVEFFEEDGSHVLELPDVKAILTVDAEGAEPIVIEGRFEASSYLFDLVSPYAGNYTFTVESSFEGFTYTPKTGVITASKDLIDLEKSTVVASTVTPEINKPLDITATFVHVEGATDLEIPKVSFFTSDAEDAEAVAEGVKGENGVWTAKYTPTTLDAFTIYAKAIGPVDSTRTYVVKSNVINPVDKILLDEKASDLIALNNPAKVGQQLMFMVKAVNTAGEPVIGLDTDATLYISDSESGNELKRHMVVLTPGDNPGEYLFGVEGWHELAVLKTAITLSEANTWSYEIRSSKVLVIGEAAKPDPTRSTLTITSRQVANAPITARFDGVAMDGTPIDSYTGLALQVRDDQGRVLETVTEGQTLGKSRNFTFKSSFVGKGSIVIVNSITGEVVSPVTATDITLVDRHESDVAGIRSVGQTVTVVFKPFDANDDLITQATDVMIGIVSNGSLVEATSAGIAPAGGFALEYKLTKEGPLVFGASSESLNFKDNNIITINVGQSLEVFDVAKSRLELSKNTGKPGDKFGLSLYAIGNRDGVFDDIDSDAVLLIKDVEAGTETRTQVSLTRRSAGIYDTSFVLETESIYESLLEFTTGGNTYLMGEGSRILVVKDAAWGEDGTYYPRGDMSKGIPLFGPGWVMNPEWSNDMVMSTDAQGVKRVVDASVYMASPESVKDKYSPTIDFLKFGDAGYRVHPDLLVTSTVIGWTIRKARINYSNKTFVNRTLWSLTKDKSGKDVYGYKPAGRSYFVGLESDDFKVHTAKHVSTHNGIMFFDDLGGITDTPLLSADYRDTVTNFGQEGWLNEHRIKDFKGVEYPNINHLGVPYGNDVLWDARGKVMYVLKSGTHKIVNDEYVLDNLTEIPETSPDFIDRPHNRQHIAYTGNRITVWDVGLVPDSFSSHHDAFVKFGTPLSTIPEIWDNERMIFAFDDEGKPIKGFRNGPQGVWDQYSDYFPSGVYTELDRHSPGTVGWMHPALSNKYTYITDTNKPQTAQDVMPDYNGIPHGSPGWYVDPTWLSRPGSTRAFLPDTGEAISFDEKGSIGYLLVNSWTDRGYRVIAKNEGGHNIIDIVDSNSIEFERIPDGLLPVAKDRFGIYILEEELVPDYIAPGISKPIKYGQPGWLPSQRVVMLNGIDGFDGNGPIITKPIDPESVVYHVDEKIKDTEDFFRIEVSISREFAEFPEASWDKGKLMAVKVIDGEVTLVEPSGVLIRNKDPRVFEAVERAFNRQRAVFHYQSNVPMKETLVYVTEPDMHSKEGVVASKYLEIEFVGKDLSTTRMLEKPDKIDVHFFEDRPWIPLNSSYDLLIQVDTLTEGGQLLKTAGVLAFFDKKYRRLTEYKREGWVYTDKVFANNNPRWERLHPVSVMIPCWDMYETSLGAAFVPYDPRAIKPQIVLINDTIVLGYNDNAAAVMVRYLSTDSVHLDQIVRHDFDVELIGANYGGREDVSFITNKNIRYGETHLLIGIDPELKGGDIDNTTLTTRVKTSYDTEMNIPEIAVMTITDEGEAITVAQAYQPGELMFESDVRGETLDAMLTYPKLPTGTQPKWYFVNPVTGERVYVNMYGPAYEAADEDKRLITTQKSSKDKEYFTSNILGVDEVKFKTVRHTYNWIHKIVSQNPDKPMIPEIYYIEENPWEEYNPTGTQYTYLTLYVRDKNHFPVNDAFFVELNRKSGAGFLPSHIEFSYMNYSTDDGYAVYRSKYRYGLSRNFGEALYQLTSGTGWDYEIKMEYRDNIYIPGETHYIEYTAFTHADSNVLADGLEKSVIRAKLYMPRELDVPRTRMFLNEPNLELVLNKGLPLGLEIVKTKIGTPEDPVYEWEVTASEHGVRSFVVRGRVNNFPEDLRFGRSHNNYIAPQTVDVNFRIARFHKMSSSTYWTFNKNPYPIDSEQDLELNGNVESIMNPGIPLPGIDDFVITGRDVSEQNASITFEFTGDVDKGIYTWKANPDRPAKFEITISSVKGEYVTQPGQVVLKVYPNFKEQPFSKEKSVIDYPNRRVVPPTATKTPVTQYFMDIHDKPLLGVWDTQLRMYPTKTSGDGRLVEKYLERNGNNQWMIGVEPIWIRITSEMLNYDSGRILATTVKGEWAEPGNFDDKASFLVFNKPSIAADGNETMIVHAKLYDGYFPDELLAKVEGSQLEQTDGTPINGDVELVYEGPGIAQFVIRGHSVQTQQIRYRSIKRTSNKSDDLIFTNPMTYKTPTPNVTEIELSRRQVIMGDLKENPVTITAYLNHATKSQFTELDEIMPSQDIRDIQLVDIKGNSGADIAYVGEIGMGIYRWTAMMTNPGKFDFKIKSKSVYYESEAFSIEAINVGYERRKEVGYVERMFTNTKEVAPRPELTCVDVISGEGEIAYLNGGTIRGRVADDGRTQAKFTVSVDLRDLSGNSIKLDDDISLRLGNEQGRQTLTSMAIAPTSQVGIYNFIIEASKYALQEEFYIWHNDERLGHLFVINWTTSPNPFEPYAGTTSIVKIAETGEAYTDTKLHIEHEFEMTVRNIHGDLVDPTDFAENNTNDIAIGLPGYRRMERTSLGVYKLTVGTVVNDGVTEVEIDGFSSGTKYTFPLVVENKVKDMTLLNRKAHHASAEWNVDIITPVRLEEVQLTVTYAKNNRPIHVLPDPSVVLKQDYKAPAGDLVDRTLVLDFDPELSDIDAGKIVYVRRGFVPYLDNKGKYICTYDDKVFNMPYEITEKQLGELFTVKYSNVYFDVPDENYMTRAMIYVSIVNLKGMVNIMYRPVLDFTLKALGTLTEGYEFDRHSYDKFKRISPFKETNGTFYYALTEKFPVGAVSEVLANVKIIDGRLSDLRSEKYEPVKHDLRPRGPFAKSKLYSQFYSDSRVQFGKYKVVDGNVQFDVHTSFQYEDRLINSTPETLRADKATTLFSCLDDGIEIEVLSREYSATGPDWAKGEYSGGETCRVKLTGKPNKGDKAVILARTSNATGEGGGYAGAFVASYEENEEFFIKHVYEPDAIMSSITNLTGNRPNDINSFDNAGTDKFTLSALRGDRKPFDLSVGGFELKTGNDYQLAKPVYSSTPKNTHWTGEFKTPGFFKYAVEGSKTKAFTTPRYKVIGTHLHENDFDDGLLGIGEVVISMTSSYMARENPEEVIVVVKASTIKDPSALYYGPLTLTLKDLGHTDSPVQNNVEIKRHSLSLEGLHTFVIRDVPHDANQLYVYGGDKPVIGSVSSRDQKAVVTTNGTASSVPFVIYRDGYDTGDFDQDSLDITTNKPSITIGGQEKAIITVKAYRADNPSVPLDTAANPRLVTKSGKVIGNVVDLGQTLDGVYQYEVTSTKVGSDEFAFSTSIAVSNKTVVQKYAPPPIDPARAFMCPGKDNCVASLLIRKYGKPGTVGPIDPSIEIKDPGKLNSNCNLARATYEWHKANGTFDKDE